MNLSFFEELKDEYLQKPQGKGVFLAGVVLGFVAQNQGGSDREIKNTPLFKQIEFGRLDMKNLKKLMSRVPKLLAAYSENIKAPHLVSALMAESGRLMLMGEGKELGAEGNFAFTVGFGNATSYFWRIFKKENEKGEE